MFDLQDGGADLRIAQEIEEQRALEIGDADTACETLFNQGLHSGPSLLDGGVAELDVVFAVEGPSGRITDFGIDVTQGDWEVDVIQVEVIDAPVGQLLTADGLDGGSLVEGVPELADDEEVAALDEAIFDSAGDALAGFGFVTVVCGLLSADLSQLICARIGEGWKCAGTHHMLRPVICSQF